MTPPAKEVMKRTILLASILATVTANAEPFSCDMKCPEGSKTKITHFNETQFKAKAKRITCVYPAKEDPWGSVTSHTQYVECLKETNPPLLLSSVYYNATNLDYEIYTNQLQKTSNGYKTYLGNHTLSIGDYEYRRRLENPNETGEKLYSERHANQKTVTWIDPDNTLTCNRKTSETLLQLYTGSTRIRKEFTAKFIQASKKMINKFEKDGWPAEIVEEARKRAQVSDVAIVGPRGDQVYFDDCEHCPTVEVPDEFTTTNGISGKYENGFYAINSSEIKATIRPNFFVSDGLIEEFINPNANHDYAIWTYEDYDFSGDDGVTIDDGFQQKIDISHVKSGKPLDVCQQINDMAEKLEAQSIKE
jgi:hypothetical protein